MPCFQRQGVGALLLQTINLVCIFCPVLEQHVFVLQHCVPFVSILHLHCLPTYNPLQTFTIKSPRCCLQLSVNDSVCLDVTYEDPADDLQALRERLDLERCAVLPLVWAAAEVCMREALVAQAADAPAHQAHAGLSSGSRGVGTDLTAADVAKITAAQEVISALEPPKQARAAICALKISVHQVAAVWDCLLWAVALRGGVCSQDDVAELLQMRVMHRTLKAVAETSKDDGEAVPQNKVLAFSVDAL
jgi:hypothetical protein